MYLSNRPKQSYHSKIQQYASQKIICGIIQQYLNTNKNNFGKLPKHLKQLPEDYFLVQLLKNNNSIKTILRPFISPTTLMKLYNNKYSKYKFTISEAYFYYEPSLDNKKHENQSDGKDFFFQAKKQSKQIKQSDLTLKLKNLMNAYQQKNKIEIVDSNEYQQSYLIPQDYYPLIALKIKYEIFFNGQKKNGFQYLIVRFEEHQTLSSTVKIYKEAQRKQNLKKILQKKKIERDNQVKRDQISKKQQLKKSYKIKNFSIGWMENQQPQAQRKQYFQIYFDIKILQNNLKHLSNQKNNKISTNSYIFFKKGEYQSPRFEILSFLYDEIVIKCLIKLSDIKKVKFFLKNQEKYVYIYLNKYPQYFIHTLDKNTGFTLFNLGPWERIQNFPIQYQQMLNKSVFMRNMLSSNSIILINFQTNNKEFQKIIKYFQAQEIIQSEFLKQKPLTETKLNYEPFNKKLENYFNNILCNIKESRKRILIHHIKFSLMSLKSMDMMQISFQDIINFLENMQNESITELDKYNTVLKNMCISPHQLLSDCFSRVFDKFYKRLCFITKFYEKTSQQLSIDTIIQIEEYLEIDNISEFSDIQSVSEISEAQTELIQAITNSKIEKIHHILIPRIRLTPNGIIYAGWTKEVASKILKHYREFEYQFLKAEIYDDENRKIQNSPHILQSFLRKQMDQIQILNETYIPLGWSQSQLREGILWYTLESKYIKTVSRQQILNFLGDFDEEKYLHLKNPALKAARIGQNFGASWSFDASNIQFIQQEDLCVKGKTNFMFSDGIGCISELNMEEFRESLNLNSLAAIQVRYKGIKGILSLNKQLKQNTAIIRKSMDKYKSQHPQGVKYFNIVDYSKYKVGYLNRQIIIMLIANGINSSKIIEIQAEYIKKLNQGVFEILFENISFQDSEQNIFYLQQQKDYESISEVFKMILPKTYEDKKEQINSIIFDQLFFKALKIQAKRRLLSRLKEKCRIRVDKSVRLFGILDEFNVLGPYQVYCSILKKQSKQKQNISGKCILTKNPCMHPADIRVVTCVSDVQIRKRLKSKKKNQDLFQDLVNVIIFPQQGEVPLTMEISQADLDGDQFFLSWDQRIIPYKMHPAFVIAQKVPFIERKWTGSGYKEMLDFFMEFQNFNKLGRLANNHLILADLKGAFCKQCIQLCKIHSVAVQYPKRGYDFEIKDEYFYHMYPHYMEKQHPLKSYRSTSVLGLLYNEILKESDLSKFRNKISIFNQKDINYDVFISRYVDLELIHQIRQKYERPIRIHPLMRDYQPKADDIEPEFENEILYQDPLPFNDVKNEYQIQNENFFQKQKVPFSQSVLIQLNKLIQSSSQAQKYDKSKPFSLIEILTTYNYMCMYYFQIKQLSQFLESQYESIYTIYFQLHTSSKNKNNIKILQRIHRLRDDWLYFFAEELVEDGAFKDTKQFQKYYFEELIDKKPKYETMIDKLKGLKDRLNNGNFKKNKISYDQSSATEDQISFINQQIQNINIVHKSTSYQTYRYAHLKQISPQLYRKIVLYYMVSTHFSELIKTYNINQLYYKLKNKYDILSMSFQKNKLFSIESFIKKELPKAQQFYDKIKIDLLGFSWFCMPKLMVIWWRDIAMNQNKRIQQKKQEDMKRLSKQSKQQQEKRKIFQNSYFKSQSSSINPNMLKSNTLSQQSSTPFQSNRTQSQAYQNKKDCIIY